MKIIEKSQFLFLPAALSLIVALSLSYITVVGQELNGSIKKEMPRSIIYGKWRFTDQLDRYLQFLPNGEVNFIVESDSEQCQYGIKYRLEQVCDTLYLIRQHGSGYVERNAIRISGDYMADYSFKELEGITAHIDEYGFQVRDSVVQPRPFDEGLPITKFILPCGFHGHVTIAFNQINGVAPEYDTQANRIVRIPPNGLLKTQLKEDAFGVAARRFAFLIPDSTTEALVMLPSYDKFENPYMRESLTNTFGVFMQGFNQLSREDVNRLFGEPIVGNTLMFFVDTYGKTKYLGIGRAWF